MSGALNMGSNKVSAVATPTADTDAATKKYVDDKVSGAAYQLPVAGPNTLGGVKVGTGLNITSDGTLSATGGGGGVGDYLPLAGGTMSGDIVMSEGTAINLGSAATGSVYNDNGDVAIKSEAGKVLAIGSEVRAITPDGSPAKVTNVERG